MALWRVDTLGDMRHSVAVPIEQRDGTRAILLSTAIDRVVWVFDVL